MPLFTRNYLGVEPNKALFVSYRFFVNPCKAFLNHLVNCPPEPLFVELRMLITHSAEGNPASVLLCDLKQEHVVRGELDRNRANNPFMPCLNYLEVIS